MSDENLNIEEIREKCNAAVDYLKIEFKKMYNTVKASNDEWYQKNKTNLMMAANPSFIDKIVNVFKFGVNIFAATVLGIDREFLDFSTYKSKKYSSYSPVDIVYGVSRILDKSILTLDNVKEKINADDSQLLFFYRGLMKINDYNFWHIFFNTVEKMNVELKYQLKDRLFFFNEAENESYTPNRVIENGLYKILGSNELTKTSKKR